MAKKKSVRTLVDDLREEIDPAAEWVGMPEYYQEDQTPYQSVYVHFANQADVDAFAKLIGQKITFSDRGRYTTDLWFPPAQLKIASDKRWADADVTDPDDVLDPSILNPGEGQ